MLNKLTSFLRSDSTNDIRDKLEKQNEFLKYLATCIRITVAAQKARITVSQVHEWKREDIMFRQRFEEVSLQAFDVLEDEAIRRAYSGVETPIIKSGEIVGYRTVYSDQLMIKILEARHPAYQEAKLRAMGEQLKPLLILPANGTELKELPAESERIEIPREQEIDSVEVIQEKAEETNLGIYQEPRE
jgi:hypothetical protein